MPDSYNYRTRKVYVISHNSLITLPISEVKCCKKIMIVLISCEIKEWEEVKGRYLVMSRENKKNFNLLGSCSQPFVCTLISSIRN